MSIIKCKDATMMVYTIFLYMSTEEMAEKILKYELYQKNVKKQYFDNVKPCVKNAEADKII